MRLGRDYANEVMGRAAVADSAQMSSIVCAPSCGIVQTGKWLLSQEIISQSFSSSTTILPPSIEVGPCDWFLPLEYEWKYAITSGLRWLKAGVLSLLSLFPSRGQMQRLRLLWVDRAIRLKGSRVPKLACGKKLCTKLKHSHQTVILNNIFNYVKWLKIWGLFVRQLVLP